MSEAENRSSRLTIRLSNRERTDLKGKADKLGFDESEYVRKMLGKGELKQIIIPQINRDTYQELTRLRIEMTRQGVNLNQLVKLANSQQQTPAEVNRQLTTLIFAYQQLQAKIVSYQSQVSKLNRNDRKN
jgi:MobC-like protein